LFAQSFSHSAQKGFTIDDEDAPYQREIAPIKIPCSKPFCFHLDQGICVIQQNLVCFAFRKN
jgi:hypothetical protein